MLENINFYSKVIIFYVLWSFLSSLPSKKIPLSPQHHYHHQYLVLSYAQSVLFGVWKDQAARTGGKGWVVTTFLLMSSLIQECYFSINATKNNSHNSHSSHSFCNNLCSCANMMKAVIIIVIIIMTTNTNELASRRGCPCSVKQNDHEDYSMQ